MEGYRMSKQREEEIISYEMDRIIKGLDRDPVAAERRYARIKDEMVREKIRWIRIAFVGLDRACSSSSEPADRPLRCISFRKVGGKFVEVPVDEEVPTNGGVGEPPSSVAPAAVGSEDELCSALGSARF